MPEVLTHQQKRERLGKIVDEANAIIHTADETKRAMSPEEVAKVESLTKEGKTLHAEIKADKGEQLREEVAALKTASEQKQDLGFKLDDPNAFIFDSDDPVEKELKLAHRDFRRGRFGLRYFQNDIENRRQGHLNAYLSALLLMAASDANGPFGNWARDRLASKGVSDWHKLAPFQAEDGNSMGGYLVFPEFERTLIILREKYGVFQQEAFKLPMTSDTKIVPRRAGGTTVYYPGENSQLTESAMKFDQLQLICKKYAQMTRWSTELNEDSVIAMADLLAGEMAYEFVKAEDTNGWNGDGTSTYAGTVGILYRAANTVNGVNAAGSVFTATGHTSLGATTAGDYEGVVGILPLYAEAGAKWYMHKTAFWAGPARIVDALGGNVAMFLITGSPLRFMGYEVVLSQAMPNNTAATTGTIPIALGDMKRTAYMGVRRGVTVRTSDQRYIEFDQIAIQCTERVAITNAVGDPVAPATVAGPMVFLKLG